MASQKPKPDTADWPNPKARAASLRAQAARTMPAAQASAPSQPALTANDSTPALAALIAEHRALLASHNDERHPDPVADVLFDRAYARFREACAIPATSAADLRAKFDMVEPELREAVEALGSLATCALDSLAADIARLHPAGRLHEGLAPHPTADYGDLPDPRPLTANLSLAALSIRDLFALHNVAGTINDVACALICQPRCSGDAPAGELTPAGHFAEWIHALAGQVSTAALVEALRRSAGSKDEDYRLRVLADYVLTNGDQAEMRAYARDVVAAAGSIKGRR